MQRALKMAGVKGMMVSLWSVGDLSSYKLFSYFYEELENQQEKNIHKAWKVARKKLSEYVHYTPYFKIETLEEDVECRCAYATDESEECARRTYCRPDDQFLPPPDGWFVKTCDSDQGTARH